MKKKSFRYFKVTERGVLKYIKTNYDESEVLIFISGRPNLVKFPDPYPNWEHFEDVEISKDEYDAAVEKARKLIYEDFE